MESGSLHAALEREHREIDLGIEAFLSGPDADASRAEGLSGAVAALRRHIYLEEQFLFPALRDAGLVAPVFVMVREHGRMWQTLDRLEQELGDRTARVTAQETCRELVAQLQAHNPKEEQILYPQADTALTASTTVELRTFLRSGQLPDGWTCEAARSRS